MTWYWLTWITLYLRIGDFHITPPSINHVPLCQHSHLYLVTGEPNEAKPLGLASLDVLLDLNRNNLWADAITFLFFLFFTWAISTSPKGSKYSRSSGSVVFQGNPKTIKSEHLFFSTRLFLANELSEWSSDFLLSAVKTPRRILMHYGSSLNYYYCISSRKNRSPTKSCIKCHFSLLSRLCHAQMHLNKQKYCLC